MEAEKELAAIAGELRRHVRWAQALGETHAPLASAAALAPAPTSAPAVERAPMPAADAPVRIPPAAPSLASSRPAPPPEPRAMPVAPPRAPAPIARPAAASAPGWGELVTLDQVRATLGACTRCKLCDGRKNLVFGVGNPNAELVFVGEGPGADEDEQGEPFVGKAGQLLTRMIEAMGYRRDEVYICNVVKCRPPGNRNPEPDEIAACEPFLRGQLAAIKPKAIVALGKFAAQTLLRDETPITRLRGQWRSYEGIRLMPTFHPAYLLRSPAEKAKTWEDLQAVMKLLGKQSPVRSR